MSIPSIPGIGLPKFGIDTVMNIGKTSLKNKLGQKILGAIASSPFGDYEREYKESVQGTKENKNFFQQAIKFVRNYLTAWGYLAIPVGMALKVLKSKIFSKEGNPNTVIDNIVGLASNILLYAAPIAAFVGQVLPFQKSYALGERKMAEMQRAEMDRQEGKKIFEELNVEKDIHKPAEKLRNVLTYERRPYSEVFNRSDSEDIETAFIFGPSGTGKTVAGVVVLSNWAKKKVENEGHEAKIKQLNLSVLTERAEKLKEGILQRAELIGSASQELADIVKKDIGDPLMVFELFISEIEEEIKENKTKNKQKEAEGKKQQKLAYFIDEYDKIGAMARSSTDVNRFVRVITRLNSLLTQKEVPIVITSNKTISQIRDDLRAIIPEDLWQQYVEPHLQRLEAVGVLIDDPKDKEQAEMLAKYVLDKFPKELIDIKFGDNGEAVKLTDNKLQNVYLLREPILAEISSQFGSNRLNGRFLEVAVKSCAKVISSSADEVRQMAQVVNGKKLGFSDDEWSKLDYIEKAKIILKESPDKSGAVMVTVPRLKKLVQAIQAERLKNKYKDDDPEFAYKNRHSLAKAIVKEFITQKKDFIAPHVQEFLKGKIDDESIIGLISKVYGSKNGRIYSSSDDVVVKVGEEEKAFQHGIMIDKTSGKVQIYYVDPSKNISTKSGFNAIEGVESSDEIPLKEFLNDFLNQVFLVFGKPRKFDFYSALNAFRNIMSNSGSVDPTKFKELFDTLGLEFP